MSIENLIERLASDARPVQRHAFRTMICPPLVIGASWGLVVMVMSIGLRPDLEESDTLAQLMVGGGLGLGSAIAGLSALRPSLRPDMNSALPKRILTAVLVFLATLAAIQLSTHQSGWPSIYPDARAESSPWMVSILAIPSFLALTLRIQSEAPTHLNVSGAALGLTSGGVGAFLYAFGCSEGSASLGIAWSSVGIGLTTLSGMLLAAWLLRW